MGAGSISCCFPMTCRGDSLYDRIGGSNGISAIVDGLFDRVVKDDRLRSVFCVYTTGDVSTLKARYALYLAASFGTPFAFLSSKGLNLRDVHREVNLGKSVTGTQFGAVLELAIDAMLELDIDLMIVEEVTYELLNVYNDILNKEYSLCSRLGGLPVITALVRDTCNTIRDDKLFHNPRLQAYFQCDVHAPISRYLSAIVFGGSRDVEYRGPGFKVFDDEHLSYEQCTVVRGAFAAAMMKFAVPADEMEEVQGLLLALEQLVAER